MEVSRSQVMDEAREPDVKIAAGEQQQERGADIDVVNA